MAKAGLVDDFEKFNALKVPVPEDKYTAQVDAEEKEDVKRCAEFLSLSNTRTEAYEKELEKMNIIPFNQIIIEDLNEVFPETKLDKKTYPYWPHRPIESLLTCISEKALALELYTLDIKNNYIVKKKDFEINFIATKGERRRGIN